MKKLKQWLILLMSVLLLPAYAAAQDTYRMTGAARFDQGNDFHNLSFPVNPVMAGFLTFDGNTFVYHETGNSCRVKVSKRMSFYVDPVISHSFGSLDNFNSFLSSRFHANGAVLTDTYLLGDADVPLCSGLRYAAIYKSQNEMLLLDGSWAYLFERQTHAPANAEQSFDCKKAGTNVEHLICNSPELVKLDATVNRGYVAMLLTDSKEISYQDPVRLEQINWIRKVRNACTDNACLRSAYRARIQYIKGRIATTYPSYPDDNSDQEGD
ncbi:lysozyme inhibitor LprI family protein [Burkholderia sp. LMG 32019]|uniref:lysozyme inhibitor LprI family protein n=1 Tax=Burkholderia sp. LMG 32019 TaxID=3158173 RepID=UPI003C2F2235